MPEPGSPDALDRPDCPDWMKGRAEALGPGHGQVARVVVRDGLVGAGRVGALKLGRGEIRSLKIADLEVGPVRVGQITRPNAPEK